MTKFFHYPDQTKNCAETKRRCALGFVYCSCDILNPTAFAHMIEHIAGKEVGCDAKKWTSLYPTTEMFRKFLHRCRAHSIKVHLFNFNVERPDIVRLISMYLDTISSFQCCTNSDISILSDQLNS